MAEVPFRPVRQLSEYKGKGASASREGYSPCAHLRTHLTIILRGRAGYRMIDNQRGA